MSQRILVSYILYALYAPHPISINPFQSALFDTFVKEKNVAAGTTSDNEQLVWVLWKILKGDGNDVRAVIFLGLVVGSEHRGPGCRYAHKVKQKNYMHPHVYTTSDACTVCSSGARSFVAYRQYGDNEACVPREICITVSVPMLAHPWRP